MNNTERLINTFNTTHLSMNQIREELRAFSEHDLNNLVTTLEKSLKTIEEEKVKRSNIVLNKKKKLDQLTSKREAIINHLNSLPVEPDDGKTAYRFHRLANTLSKEDYKVLEDYQQECFSHERLQGLESSLDYKIELHTRVQTLAKKLIRNLNLEDKDIIPEKREELLGLKESNLFT